LITQDVFKEIKDPNSLICPANHFNHFGCISIEGTDSSIVLPPLLVPAHGITIDAAN